MHVKMSTAQAFRISTYYTLTMKEETEGHIMHPYPMLNMAVGRCSVKYSNLGPYVNTESLCSGHKSLNAYSLKHK